ncbi:hypothetical protein Tco_1015045 [Tanacetum coccineum]|uniref:MAK10-like protein n=1 Tax=Tanacetum coccineum TaxID=301880 RepID=A0ABQ5FJS9_9ASTR
MGVENPIRTLRDYSRPSHKGYQTTIVLPDGNNVVLLRSDTIRLVQNGCSFHGLRSEDPNQHLKDFLKLVDSLNLDVANRIHLYLGGSYYSFPCSIHLPGRTAKLRNDILMFQQHQGESLSEASADGKLHDKNAEDSWALLEDLSLYENESWNDPRDFAKPVKSISLAQDVLSISDRRLIELENRVQRLMEAHLARKPPIQVNKITSSCEIYSGPYDIQYCIENPEQAFVDYASSSIKKVGVHKTAHSLLTPINYQTRLGRVLSNFDSSQEKRLSSLETQLRQQQDDVINKINTLWRVVSKKFDDMPAHDTARNSMACVNATSNRNPSSPKRVHFDNSIIILKKENEPEEEDIMMPNATKDNDRNIMAKEEEEAKNRREESNEEIEDEETE